MRMFPTDCTLKVPLAWTTELMLIFKQSIFNKRKSKNIPNLNKIQSKANRKRYKIQSV